MAKKNLKLYVWPEVFCDYTCGMAVAIAETLEEAADMIIPPDSWQYDRRIKELVLAPDVIVIDLKKPEKFVCYCSGGG